MHMDGAQAAKWRSCRALSFPSFPFLSFPTPPLPFPSHTHVHAKHTHVHAKHGGQTRRQNAKPTEHSGSTKDLVQRAVGAPPPPNHTPPRPVAQERQPSRACTARRETKRTHRTRGFHGSTRTQRAQRTKRTRSNQMNRDAPGQPSTRHPRSGTKRTHRAHRAQRHTHGHTELPGRRTQSTAMASSNIPAGATRGACAAAAHDQE